MWQEGHGRSRVASCSPVLWLIVEARGLRSGQLAQGLVHRFGLAVRGRQGMAGGVAEQDRCRQGGGEEDVSVLLGVLGCGRGIACRLLETEEQRSLGAVTDLEDPSAAITLLCSGRFLRTVHLPWRQSRYRCTFQTTHISNEILYRVAMLSPRDSEAYVCAGLCAGCWRGAQLYTTSL